MTVLPSFVPTPTATADREAVSERPFFMCVGRLEKLKGIQDMIELFRGYRDADLVIIGDGGYRPVLEQLARGLEHVRLLGGLHPSELGAYYRARAEAIAKRFSERARGEGVEAACETAQGVRHALGVSARDTATGGSDGGGGWWSV